MTLSLQLDKVFGNYRGYVGQQRPCVEMVRKASGSRLRFFPFASSKNVTFVTLPAEGGVSSQNQSPDKAEALFVAALRKGYVVTSDSRR